VVCGVSTDCCVLSTALAAADAGVFVQIGAAACAGVSRADHERALDTMRLYAPLITVTSTEDVLRTQ
jgi:nicotinamidase-related amidase